MWDGFNKRRFPRIKLRCEVTLRTRKRSAPFKTITENVGAGGIAVLLPEPLNRFSECHLRLELDPKQDPLETDGKVVWVIPTSAGKPAPSRKTFDTGIEFLRIPEDAREAVRQFIESRLPKGFREVPRSG